MYGDYIVPFVYVMLADKGADTYYRVINIIRDAFAVLGCVFDPEIIISDFESGFIEAVRKQFPRTNHKGCHFHYSQALWRKVQELGLVTSYRDNEEIASLVKSCIALAFVPELEVISELNRIVNLLSPMNLVLLDNFLDYFHATWLGGLFSISSGASMGRATCIALITRSSRGTLD